MRIANISLLLVSMCAVLACSPRDFLTRRLAADLISATDSFKEPQIYWLMVGVVSNKDFNSPEMMVLQGRGWIIGTEQKCPAGIDPSPCWDVVLTPLGVDAIRPLIVSGSAGGGPLGIQVARRKLIEISGISKSGNFADVDFSWRWVGLNQVGKALYDGGVYYRSRVGFRAYDDGWRVITESVRNNQTLDEALRTAEPNAP
jgi:hypothetical protein